MGLDYLKSDNFFWKPSYVQCKTPSHQIKHASLSKALFLQGTSAEQDNRFSDKEKKLLKQMRFADHLSKRVSYINYLHSKINYCDFIFIFSKYFDIFH